MSTTVPPQELADRQALGARYEASQELAKVQDKIRGHRSAINTLIREEKELMRRAQELDDMVHGRQAE